MFIFGGDVMLHEGDSAKKLWVYLKLDWALALQSKEKRSKFAMQLMNRGTDSRIWKNELD